MGDAVGPARVAPRNVVLQKLDREAEESPTKCGNQDRLAARAREGEKSAKHKAEGHEPNDIFEHIEPIALGPLELVDHRIEPPFARYEKMGRDQKGRRRSDFASNGVAASLAKVVA